MPATEFNDPIFVDKDDVICPGGPFRPDPERRQEALAVQFHFLILQGDAIAHGTNSCGKDDVSWFGRAEQKEGAFDFSKPAQAYGLAVVLGKGEYQRDGSDQYIPVFETIAWSKTVDFQRVDTVTPASYQPPPAPGSGPVSPQPVSPSG